MTPINAPPIIRSFTMNPTFDVNTVRLIVGFNLETFTLLATVHKYHIENNLPILLKSRPQKAISNKTSTLPKVLTLAANSKNTTSAYRISAFLFKFPEEITPIGPPSIIRSFTMNPIFDVNTFRLIVGFNLEILTLLATVHKYHTENSLPALPESRPQKAISNKMSIFQEALNSAAHSSNIAAAYRVNALMPFISLQLKNSCFKELNIEQRGNVIKIAGTFRLYKLMAYLSEDAMAQMRLTLK